MLPIITTRPNSPRPTRPSDVVLMKFKRIPRMGTAMRLLRIMSTVWWQSSEKDRTVTESLPSASSANHVFIVSGLPPLCCVRDIGCNNDEKETQNGLVRDEGNHQHKHEFAHEHKQCPSPAIVAVGQKKDTCYFNHDIEVYRLCPDWIAVAAEHDVTYDQKAYAVPEECIQPKEGDDLV